MRLIIKQSLQAEETEITIVCSAITPELERIIAMIRRTAFAVQGSIDQTIYKVPLEKILYFDSVDNRTFFYTMKDTYDCKEKLYTLEERLQDASFLRISKNTIVNLGAIQSVSPMPAERMIITLKNEERLIITRHYLPMFKRKFDL